MDGWLKALVGAACIVVILGGGYFAYDLHHQRAQQVEDSNNATIRAGCRDSLLDKNLRAMREFCRDKGLITDDEFYSAGL